MKRMRNWQKFLGGCTREGTEVSTVSSGIFLKKIAMIGKYEKMIRFDTSWCGC